MKTNLWLCVPAVVLLSGMQVFSAEFMLDFDGGSKKDKGLKAFVTENTSGIVSVQEKADNELVVKREILTDSGEWAELKPTRSWDDGDGTHRNQYTVFPNSAWRWSLRCPKAGSWTARKVYELRPDQLGGHYHWDAPPPSLAMSSVSMSASTAPFHSVPSPILFSEMKGNTTYYYWEWFPAFSTKIVEKFDFYGACQGITQIDYINVEVQGLRDMPYGANYLLDNSQDGMGYHPDVHYGSQKLIDTLTAVANEYREIYPNSERLGIRDMSLPWGGLFDLNYDWKEPHYGHTIGADADINRGTVPLENRHKLLEIMCRHTPGIFLERDILGEPPHFHMRVYGKTEFQLEGSLGSGERALACCKGNEVDPANLQTCISARN